MRADVYLDQIKKIDLIIINKRDDYKRWVDIATGLGSFSDSERVKSSSNPQKIPNAIIKYVDIEREIDELKRKRAEIIKTIERLPSAEYMVIYSLYVEGYTLKEISYRYKKSYEWAKKKKQRGLMLIQRIIDEVKP